MPRLAAAALALLLALSAAVAAAPEAPRLAIEAPPALVGSAAELRQLPADRLAAVARLVGLADPGPPLRVILLPEDHPVARRTPWRISGFATDDPEAAVLFPARAAAYPNDGLWALAVHEAAHLLLHRAAGGRPVPRWFDEGVALLASRGFTFADRSHALSAALSGEPLTSAELEASFSGGDRDVERAYAVAGALVHELVGQHGSGAVADIAGRLGAGEAFDAAFSGATGETLADFERRFWRRFRIFYRWLPFATSGTALWLGVTALFLLATARRRAASEAVRRRWELEEEEARLARQLASLAVRSDPPDEGDEDGEATRWTVH